MTIGLLGKCFFRIIFFSNTFPFCVPTFLPFSSYCFKLIVIFMFYVKLKESNEVSVQLGWFHFGKKIDFKFDFLELCRSLLYGKELIAEDATRLSYGRKRRKMAESVVKS